MLSAIIPSVIRKIMAPRAVTKQKHSQGIANLFFWTKTPMDMDQIYLWIFDYIFCLN